MQLLPTDSEGNLRRWWVAILPALLAGFAYYSSYSGAAVTAMIFPLMLVWWPGLPAAVFLIFWSGLERFLLVKCMASTPICRVVVTGLVASGLTVLIGGLILEVLDTTSSAAILRLVPGWSVPFVACSVLSCWLWAVMSERHRASRDG